MKTGPIIVETEGMSSAMKTHRDIFGEYHPGRAAEQLVEEASELIVEIQHMKRGRRNDILGEIADVIVCIDFLCDGLGITKERLWEIATAKADRLKERLLDHGDMNDKADTYTGG